MQKKQATINARIPAALRQQVDDCAARRGLKPSRILQTALEEYLARQSANENAITIEIVKEET